MIFDAHCHIIHPAFPLQANAGFLPQRFTVDDYLTRVAPLGVAGGVVVSGSFQGFDQGYLLNALARLGSAFVGVTQLPVSTPDRTIRELAERGVQGVRFNLKRGLPCSPHEIEVFAARVHDLAGWHAELYVDADGLAALRDLVLRLPAVSIDHLGLSAAGLQGLIRLAEKGVRVKATGFGRVDFAVPDVLRAIHEANPDALMFGTDLPSTRAARPFADEDLRLIRETLGDSAARLVLWDNARRFYRLPPGQTGSVTRLPGNIPVTKALSSDRRLREDDQATKSR